MFDIHQSPVDQYGEFDEQAMHDYIDCLMKEFAESDEAAPLLDEFGDIGWAGMVIDYGFNYHGESPPQMTVGSFNDVLFGLFPRKVSVEPDKARDIVTELRAFWQFCARHYGLANAANILKSLNEFAIDDLRNELADSSNWGMAKSFVMAGQESGYDMNNQADMNRFMFEYNRRIAELPPRPFKDSLSLDDSPTAGFSNLALPAGKTRSQKRSKQKAQRQARKKNRHKK